MNKKEITNFMKTIKGHYQEFSIEDYIVQTWYERLKEYDIEDVYSRLEKHLNGEYRKNPPRLQFLVDNLKTPEEKEKTKVIMTRCMYCNKVLPYEENDKHLSRHNSINYIKSKEHLLNKNYNEEKMLNSDESKFNIMYHNFLTEIYPYLTKEEQSRLDNFIFNY